jgi:hypothetical protein
MYETSKKYRLLFAAESQTAQSHNRGRCGNDFLENFVRENCIVEILKGQLGAKLRNMTTQQSIARLIHTISVVFFFNIFVWYLYSQRI